MQPVASVVITTRGRCKELRKAVLSCREQTGVAIEVLVYDDASEDETQEMVTREFPDVRYFRSEKHTGYIVLRNRGFEDAIGRYVFSIDDDAWFSQPETVAEVVQQFESQPDVAAFALRYTEPLRQKSQGFMQPVDSGQQVRNYIGCAHALQRQAALDVGGYVESLIHQGEERDLCIRLLERGQRVVYLHTAPIVHEPSPKRDHAALNYLGLRNTFVFDVLNVPFPYIVYRLPADVFLLLKHKVSRRTFPKRLWHVFRALFALAAFVFRRAPVSKSTYQKFRSLPSHGAVEFSTLLKDFPGLSDRITPIQEQSR